MTDIQEGNKLTENQLKDIKEKAEKYANKEVPLKEFYDSSRQRGFYEESHNSHYYGYIAAKTEDAIEIKGLLEAVTLWAFREGWGERARMTGVNKKALDKQYYERQRIIIDNKHYEKAVSRYKESLNPSTITANK